jgi:transposase
MLDNKHSPEVNGMQLKTILNQIYRHHGFVYEKAVLNHQRAGLEIHIYIRPHARNRPLCSRCGRRGPGYDTLKPARHFVFVPLWGVPVTFVYAMRRVDCVRCDVRVEQVPWADGKSHLTKAFAWFLARWAKRMSWKDVAQAFQTSWDNVFRAVKMAVDWGRKHRNLENIASIGIDEIYWSKSKKFVTLVYQIDEGCKRLLWIGRKRKIKTLLGFFRWFGQQRSRRLRFVCSDMWKPYLKVVAKKAEQAVHVLDRFHIMSHMSKAIDEVRAQEARRLKANGFEPILSSTRWLLLKKPSKLSKKQETKLADLVQYNLRTVRSYLLKEEFQFFWNYISPYWAGRFLDRWCTKAMRSRIEPMKKVARMLRKHHPLILNWFKAKGQISTGTVEGFNGKAKVITRRAFGFRTYEALEVALYHTLGELPEMEFTHRFC